MMIKIYIYKDILLYTSSSVSPGKQAGVLPGYWGRRPKGTTVWLKMPPSILGFAGKEFS